jgi:hypothetical protein
MSDELGHEQLQSTCCQAVLKTTMLFYLRMPCGDIMINDTMSSLTLPQAHYDSDSNEQQVRG